MPSLCKLAFKLFSQAILLGFFIFYGLAASAAGCSASLTLSWGQNCGTSSVYVPEGKSKEFTSLLQRDVRGNLLTSPGNATFMCEGGRFRFLGGECKPPADTYAAQRVMQMPPAKVETLSSTTALDPLQTNNDGVSKSVTTLASTIGDWQKVIKQSTPNIDTTVNSNQQWFAGRKGQKSGPVTIVDDVNGAFIVQGPDGQLGPFSITGDSTVIHNAYSEPVCNVNTNYQGYTQYYGIQVNGSSTGWSASSYASGGLSYSGGAGCLPGG